MSGEPKDAGEAVPAAQRSSWMQFVKSIASVSGDLSSLTAPPFILSPVSLTEYPSYWGEHPELFADIADGKTEEDRALRVLRWFICTLKGQYTSRNDQMGTEKKPLNPTLGELFLGHWPDVGGRGIQTLVVEQVSHHPPITAYFIANEKKGLSLQGHNAQKTSFSAGAIIVKQIGHATLTLTLPNGLKETYLITLPRLRIDGIWYGSPYIELWDTSYIASSTGYLSVIEYKGKGYFSGKPHSFKAQVFPPLPIAASAAPGTPPTPSTTAKHTIEGTWVATSKMKNGQTFSDITGPKTEVQTGPEEEMSEYETRKLWKEVARGIRSGDFELASREKSKIENVERQKRKDELAAGETWKLQHFEHIDNDPEYERLAKLYKGVPATEDTYVYVKATAAPVANASETSTKS